MERVVVYILYFRTIELDIDKPDPKFPIKFPPAKIKSYLGPRIWTWAVQTQKWIYASISF